MKIIKLKEQLFQVTLSEEEVDVIEEYVPDTNDLGFEVYAGDNILEKDTLWLFLCELNARKFHMQASFGVTEALKNLLYPQV